MRSSLKKWLFVLPWTLDSIGGVSEVVRNLMRQVDESGLFVSGLHVLNRVQVAENRSSEKDPDEAFIYFREPSQFLESPYRFLVFFVCLIPTLLMLRRHLLATQVSVVNIHYPGFAVFYFAIARRFFWIEKLILSFHGTDISASAAEVGLRARLFNWSCRSADALVACSQYQSLKVESVLALDRGRVDVVYNGLNGPACVEDMQSSETVDAEDDVVLCVASLEHQKGIDILIDAFATISGIHQRCRLVIVGRRTPYIEHLELQIERLVTRIPDLAKRIDVIHGESHGRILQRMKSACMVVLPSRKEAFGLVLLESGFVGVPVVATAVGGIPEIVDHEVNGLLVPSENAAALAQACHRMLEDAELRDRLAQSLTQRVKERFTWSAAWERYLALASTT